MLPVLHCKHLELLPFCIHKNVGTINQYFFVAPGVNDCVANNTIQQIDLTIELTGPNHAHEKRQQ